MNRAFKPGDKVTYHGMIKRYLGKVLEVTKVNLYGVVHTKDQYGNKSILNPANLKHTQTQTNNEIELGDVVKHNNKLWKVFKITYRVAGTTCKDDHIHISMTDATGTINTSAYRGECEKYDEYQPMWTEAEEEYFGKPFTHCNHTPVDMGFASQKRWCTKCDRDIDWSNEENEWVAI